MDEGRVIEYTPKAAPGASEGAALQDGNSGAGSGEAGAAGANDNGGAAAGGAAAGGEGAAGGESTSVTLNDGAAGADGATTDKTENAPALPSEFDWLKDHPLASLINAVKDGTDYKPLLQALSVDFNTMEARDVLRLQLQKDNPELADDASAIELLLKKKLINDFDLGGFDDAKNETGEKLLKAATDRMREAFKADQAKLTAPVKTQLTPEAIAAQKAQDDLEKELDSVIRLHPALAEFERNKVLKFGEGDAAINFQIPQELTAEKVMDLNDMMAPFWSQDAAGKPAFDMPAFLEVRAFALNREALRTAWINHGRTLATKGEFMDRARPDAELAGTKMLPGQQQSGGKYIVTRS